MVGSIIVISVLTHCELLNCMCDLKAIQCSLIQELMLYKFKLGYNTAETNKNVCFAKGEDTVNHSTVISWVKKFCSGCKNFNYQAMLD